MIKHKQQKIKLIKKYIKQYSITKTAYLIAQEFNILFTRHHVNYIIKTEGIKNNRIVIHN